MEYAAQPAEVARPDSTFLQRVFLWMFVGLAVDGGVAAAIGSNDQLLTDITESPEIIIGVIVVQLGIVLGISFLINQIGKEGLTGDAAGRAAIMGALALYLDFINLFLFLLRICGRER
jgi:uncharacterized protein